MKYNYLDQRLHIHATSCWDSASREIHARTNKDSE